jgi:hypothetical protein
MGGIPILRDSHRTGTFGTFTVEFVGRATRMRPRRGAETVAATPMTQLERGGVFPEHPNDCQEKNSECHYLALDAPMPGHYNFEWT